MQILPPWYLLPIYAILRSVAPKLAGVIVAAAALLAPLSLGVFDWEKVSTRAWASLLALVPVVYGLAYLGAQESSETNSAVGAVLTALYFAIFFVVFPMIARMGRPARRA
jgi:ubiquinol-cytochrome c reductase cytochrome b subunit